MTIDEEIKHQEEISDRYARMSEYEGNEGIAKDCAQCAADHAQLAEWLTELKEAKRLLGEAMRTLNDSSCNKDCRQCKWNEGGCEMSCRFAWKYGDEACALIGDETE